MAKSLNGNYKGKTPKRKINKKRLFAALASAGLITGIAFSEMVKLANSTNDRKEMIKTVSIIDQMDVGERALLESVLEDDYSKVDEFLKYSNILQEMDSSSPEYIEAANYCSNNLNSLHDIYLETIKTKLAEMGGVTNPNQIRNITIHRNIITDSEAPRYQYDVENYPEIQIDDKDVKEQFESYSTLNLNTGKRNFSIEDENFKKQVDNVIKISEFMGKDNLTETDYKQLSAIIKDYYSMTNDVINVSDKKGFFERLFSNKGDFEYEVIEDNQYEYSPDNYTFDSEVAKTDNEDMDV